MSNDKLKEALIKDKKLFESKLAENQFDNLANNNSIVYVAGADSYDNGKVRVRKTTIKFLYNACMALSNDDTSDDFYDKHPKANFLAMHDIHDVERFLPVLENVAKGKCEKFESDEGIMFIGPDRMQAIKSLKDNNPFKYKEGEGYY